MGEKLNTPARKVLSKPKKKFDPVEDVRWEVVGCKVYTWGWEDVLPPDIETLVNTFATGKLAQRAAYEHNAALGCVC